MNLKRNSPVTMPRVSSFLCLGHSLAVCFHQDIVNPQAISPCHPHLSLLLQQVVVTNEEEYLLLHQATNHGVLRNKYNNEKLQITVSSI